MKRKVIGISVVAIMAAAIVFGTVGSVMEIIAATTPATDAEYAPRLAAGDDNPALAALKYACPFH